MGNLVPIERAMGLYQNNVKIMGKHRLWAPGEEIFFWPDPSLIAFWPNL